MGNSGYYEDEVDLDDLSLEDEEEGQSYDPDKRGICTVEESLSICINDFGKVDIHYMAWLADVTEDEVIGFHGGKTIFLDPYEYMADPKRNRYDHWLLESEYLRGNLYEQLRVAKECNDPEKNLFEDNIRAIRKRMPEMPDANDIYIGLGASWIPAGVIRKFVLWLMKLSKAPDVERVEGKWRLKYISKPSPVWESTYGTDRKKSKDIILDILNARTIKVMDEVEEPDPGSKTGVKVRRVANPDETYFAERKAELIKDKFREWLAENPDIEKLLLKEYYKIYCYAIPHFNGDILSLRDMNPAKTPYKHQKDAAIRIMLSPSTVLCHDVGSGKTICYIIAIHEMYRLGISKKNMVEVPNAAFKGTVEAHRELYPQDKLLLIPPKIKEKDRKDLIREIIEGDHTAIYIAYSQFNLINTSPEWILNDLKIQMDEYTDLSVQADSQWKREYYKSMAKELSEKREKLEREREPDAMACFDSFGITTLIIDECQEYKNLYVDTKLENVVGMNTHRTGSKKNKTELLMNKIRCVRQNRGKIVFATGTLITNSISDLFVAQLYLQKETLNAANVGTFGEWANTFGEITTNFEVDVTTQGFRLMSRLSKFHNLPELMALFGQVCDFYHINETEVKLPDFNGAVSIVIKKTAHLDQFNEDILERTDLVRGKPSLIKDRRKERIKRLTKGITDLKKRAEIENKVLHDNILNIITDGRKAALDIRLIDPGIAIRPEECKAGAAAKEILRIWREHPGTAQIAFCDFSTPKDGFNVYDELKKYLIAGGMPAGMIAFIHEGTTEQKKDELLEKLDNGIISVMIGSTQKLGVGVNVQKHLIAIHHIDAPWRPSDLTQREGRLIRQGNLNPEVFQYRYITEKSFDAYIWQILENKQTFISSFLDGSMSRFHRDESEVDDVLLDIAEVKALAIGNERIRDRVNAKNQLERTRIAERKRQEQLDQMKSDLERLPAKIREQERHVTALRADRDHFMQHKVSMNQEDREAFGEELLNALKRSYNAGSERVYDTYMGFDIVFPPDMDREFPEILLRRPNAGSGLRTAYRVDMKDREPQGVTRALDGILNSITKQLDKYEQTYEALIRQKEDAEAEIEKGNPYENEVEELIHTIEEIDRELDALLHQEQTEDA